MYACVYILCVGERRKHTYTHTHIHTIHIVTMREMCIEIDWIGLTIHGKKNPLHSIVKHRNKV